MQLNRLGNIEEESDLPDLDQLEREMEMELEDNVADDVQPQQPEQQGATAQKTPAPGSTAPQQNNNFTVVNGRGKGLSKFMPQVQLRSNLFPDQPAVTVDKADAKDRKRDASSLPFATDSKFEARLRRKPANDTKPKAVETVDVGSPQPQPQDQNTPRSSRSRFARVTVEALLSMGTLPMQMLIELGRFRFAKEHRFNSYQRLEKALGQGDEDAERFLSYYPGAARKKEPMPPAPPAPGK